MHIRGINSKITFLYPLIIHTLPVIANSSIRHVLTLLFLSLKKVTVQTVLIFVGVNLVFTLFVYLSNHIQKGEHKGRPYSERLK